MKLKNKKAKVKPQPRLTGEARQRDLAVRQFHAYLHLAITARHSRRDAEFAALPGPNTLTYCQALSKAPDNLLARELAVPIQAVVDQLSQVASCCEHRLEPAADVTPEVRAGARQVLCEVDLALTMVVRTVTNFIKRRVAVTDCEGLLCEVLAGWMLDDGARLAGWIRRYEQLQPGGGRDSDGTVLPDTMSAQFARDTYARVVALDSLAVEFPGHVRPGAERLPAWPGLIYPHVDSRRRLAELAESLNLGASCSIDVCDTAGFDPEAPLVRYLLPLILRLEFMRCELGDRIYDSIEAEQTMLLHVWWRWPEAAPGEAIIAPLRVARQLPDLTQATAGQWAREVFVPLILATDARDPRNCSHPALQALAVENPGPDSSAFANALLAAVLDTLSCLVRPEETSN